MFTSLNGLLGIAFGWTSSDKAWKGGRGRLLHIAARDRSRTGVLCLCWAAADSFCFFLVCPFLTGRRTRRSSPTLEEAALAAPMPLDIALSTCSFNLHMSVPLGSHPLRTAVTASAKYAALS